MRCAAASCVDAYIAEGCGTDGLQSCHCDAYMNILKMEGEIDMDGKGLMTLKK